MAKKEVAVAAPKSKIQGPARKRRNSFQRKCLSRASKMMFQDCPRSVRAAVLSFEQENKRKAQA